MLEARRSIRRRAEEGDSRGMGRMTMMVRRRIRKRRQDVAWPMRPRNGSRSAGDTVICWPWTPRSRGSSCGQRLVAFGGIQARKRHRVSGSIMSSRGWPSGPAKQEGDILHPIGATPANMKHAWPTAVGSRGGQVCLSLPGWEWAR